MNEEALAARGIVRKTADAKPGYPCRITLEDAEPGDSVLLMNYESHKVETPYRSAYAIYVTQGAAETGVFKDEIPPVMKGRPIALRIFSEDGMLIGADLVVSGDLEGAIERAFGNEKAGYIHAHNAAHGCFSARIDRR